MRRKKSSFTASNEGDASSLDVGAGDWARGGAGDAPALPAAAFPGEGPPAKVDLTSATTGGARARRDRKVSPHLVLGKASSSTCDN